MSGSSGRKPGEVTLFGIDSMLFVYHFEDNVEFGPNARAIFRGAEQGDHRLVTSVITMLEVLVVPKRRNHESLVRRYRTIFESFPNLDLQPVDPVIVEIASSLRADHNLRTPDAIQVATAIHAKARAFISNDAELARKVREIDILPLARFSAD